MFNKYISIVWILAIICCLVPSFQKAMHNFTITFSGGFAIIAATFIIAGIATVFK